MKHKTHLWRASLFSLSVAPLTGCLAKEVEDPCNASPTFERYASEAEAAARQAYQPEVPMTCAVLDRPPDGDKFAEGVVFEEYDMPGVTMKNSIATGGGAKTAWFKDTEGNILAVSQRIS